MSADLASCAKCFCLASRRAARAVTRIYEARLRPHGLRATQFTVLVMLALRGPSTVHALADAIGVERTTLTRALVLLEERKWVRAAAASDARQRPVRLTGAGRAKVEAAYPAWKAAQEQVERKLGAAAGALQGFAAELKG